MTSRSIRGAGLIPASCSNLKSDFPEADIIALEQNYRSDQYILDIANKLIENNTARHPKRLFSERRTPNRAIVFEAADGLGEAEYVADTIIAEKVKIRGEYSAFCVLYRTNFQSRSSKRSCGRETFRTM
jgi:superfamily I DNA/RNA helicase